jgi:hypothetical protein
MPTWHVTHGQNQHTGNQERWNLLLESDLVGLAKASVYTGELHSMEQTKEVFVCLFKKI